MFLGNIALAFAAKRAAPKSSLGALILAALLPDLIWTVLLIAGVERVSVDAGGTILFPIGFVSCPISHSLLLVILWGGVAAAIHQGRTGYRAGSLAVFTLVVGHWMLDLVAHAPDLPLFPGFGPKVGLALGNSPSAVLSIEAGLFLLGVMLYLDQTRPTRRAGRFGLLGMLLFACGISLGDVSAFVPPHFKIMVATSMATFLCIPWGAWVDRGRRVPRWA